MSSTPSKNPNDEGAENALPPAIIAQAEAAIYGNLEDEAPSISERGPSSTKPDYSQYQEVSRSSTSGSKSNARNFNTPNILATEGDPEALPAYGEKHDQLELSQDGFDTKARLTDDGRININIDQKTRKLSDLLVPALRNQLSLVAQEDQTPLPPGYIPPALGGLPGQTPPPRLNVVIHVVGSRGDVQPFVALGKVLKSTYGHRVRLATHPTFQGFVEENGLEFFSIGGDPSELMAFMVKNPGLVPGFDSLKSGDVGKRRKGMEQIVLGCWRSCIEAGDGLGASPRGDSTDSLPGFEAGINMDANPSERPFIADAIIANPPSFAHIHIAEKMGIPLHMMFTMPWSPTQSFPHPLANIQSSNADVNMTNFVSYALVEMMTWQGLGDVINRFRERALGLEPISLIWAPGMLSRLRVPYTYCWSPALIPKPKDWGQHISISGFYFLSLASSFTPEPDLAAYLAAGPPPVYIGFGSIVVDNPDAMTKLIFEAVKKTGVRALVSKGWGGLGADALGIPEGVFMLGNVPHDWLFKHVSCVVHHGGAGTTAAGITLGRPTVVVPFFGDQPFWGAMIARAGAGPAPIPFKQLTADKLATAVMEALRPDTLAKAMELGARIKEENGCEVGGKSFHDLLDVDNLRCSLAPSRVAVWRVKRTKTRLSALAASVLANEGLLNFADLKLYRPREYETEDSPWDPISGGASALLGTIASLSMGVADFPIEIFKAVKQKKAVNSKAEPTNSPSSGSLTPTTSQTPSQIDLTLEGSEDQSIDESHSPSGGTTKTSESTDRSLTESRSTETPLTSTSSLSEFRGGALRQALKGTLVRSRSNSKDRSSHSRTYSWENHPGSPRREVDPSELTLDNAIGAGKAVHRIVAAGMKSPMDFTLGLARGFHNAPKLYGDDTVRPQEKIVDLQSGLKAAGKEFGYGFYDGISGLITQPIRGAEKEGTAGLIKGIGKGIGGLILKPGAAIWGLPGYTFMGIHKEVRKLFGASVSNYIISARTAQGFEESKTATAIERQDILMRWHEHKNEYQNADQKFRDAGTPEGHETGRLTPKGFFQTRHLTFDERKRLHEERKAKREELHKLHSQGSSRSCPFCRKETPHDHTPHIEPTIPVAQVRDRHVIDEFEHAISASVAATSRGNPEEDMMIERAIRASVRELQNAQGSESGDQETLNRAIRASIAEAGRRQSTETSRAVLSEEDAEHQALLEKAIQQSLLEYQLSKTETESVHDVEDVDTDDDENVKLAIQMSKEAESVHDTEDVDTDEEENVKLAMQMSKEAEEAVPPKTEEEIVLEYVKKQSLAEEEHRKTLLRKKEASHSDADEEALKQAIEESMKTHAGSSHGT